MAYLQWLRLRAQKMRNEFFSSFGKGILLVALMMSGCRSNGTESSGNPNREQNNVPPLTVRVTATRTSLPPPVKPPTEPAAASDALRDAFLSSSDFKNALPEMQSVARAIVGKGLRIDLQSLPDYPGDPTKGHECEVLSIPEANPNMRDGFHQAIVLDRSAGLFWVRLTGGFAGRTFYRGPKKIVKDEKGSFVIR